MGPSAPTGSEPGEAASDQDKEQGHRYPDFGFLPPPREYEGRVFTLSQAYPRREPPPASAPNVSTRDFEEVKKNWRQYLLDARDYCFKDNIGAPNVEDDWQVDRDSPTWFHMPWQHFGPMGREGIHGLTKEAPVQPRQLSWSQTHSGGQTYAVGFYNRFGGYTIGQVWNDHEHPAQHLKKIAFPVGTVVCKLLFVDVPPDQVPSLNPPLQWQAYITDNFASTKRNIRPVSLIQMDIMVRHKTSPNGWLFGTFQYNGKRPGANPKKPFWDNLVPVGLQWGNDPDVKDNTSNPMPITTIINKRIKESVINNDSNELPPTHLGWNGRLNGPVDNPMSSCMSCHMTAETPQFSQMSPLFEPDPPPPGSPSPGWMRWFENVKCGDKFDKNTNAQPTDFSLQMSIALQNFRTWRNEGSKLLAGRYTSKPLPARLLPIRPLGRVNPHTGEAVISRE